MLDRSWPERRGAVARACLWALGALLAVEASARAETPFSANALRPARTLLAQGEAPHHIRNTSFRLYNREFAERLSDIINRMNDAANNCDRFAYNRAQLDFNNAVAQWRQVNEDRQATLPAIARGADSQYGRDLTTLFGFGGISSFLPQYNEPRCRDREPAGFLDLGRIGYMDVAISFGVRRNTAEGGYSSNGGQLAGTGKGSETQANVGAALALYLPLALDAFADREVYPGFLLLHSLHIGARIGVNHLGDGNKLVLDFVRHGPNGAVTLTEDERQFVSMVALVRFLFFVNLAETLARRELSAAPHAADFAQAPLARRGNWWPVAVYAGIGPAFVNTKITMTSNQAPGGGVFQTASTRRWDTAFAFVLGAQTAACRDCAFGRPLMVGIEGEWMWMPPRSISLRSSTFGFTETGRVSDRSSARVMFTLSVPFGFGRAR